MPANQIIDTAPGEVFVHRNVANVVVHTDLNCLSAIQFAVDVLKVEHILVVGHYGCGGVQSVLEEKRHGLIDNWLRHVADVRQKHAGLLDEIGDLHERAARLCELNAIEQTLNVAHTTVVRDAWERGQELRVHSWIYSHRRWPRARSRSAYFRNFATAERGRSGACAGQPGQRTLIGRLHRSSVHSIGV